MIKQAISTTTLVAVLAWTPVSAWTAPLPPATPESIAAAKAEADILIAATGAPDLFLNATKTDIPRVRHLPSNLTCLFATGSADNRLEIGSGAARGDTVLCGSKDAAMATIISAKRLSARLPEAEYSAETAAAVGQTLTAATAVKTDGPAFFIDKKPFGQASTVDGQRNDRKVFVWVGAMDTGDWGITQQVEAFNPIIARMSGALLIKTTLLRLSGVIPN